MACGSVPMMLDVSALGFREELPFSLHVGGAFGGCDPLDCPEPKPAAVGDSLRLARQGEADLELSWDPVAGASDYRIWKASVADFSDEVFVGKTSDAATSFVESGVLSDPAPYCYLVRALNSCNQEGP
jgi:hypothetical protein